MQATAVLLAAVNEAQLAKVVEGIRRGTYQITITFWNTTEVSGRVTHIDGRAYDCTITQTGSFCSCPDALYRRRTCKHAILLALYELSTPPAVLYTVQEGTSQNMERQPDLKLGKVRPGFVFSP
jgi:uncharacterized Zn finger protein